MTDQRRKPVDWQALLSWYLDAGPVIDDLDSCCTVVRTMREATSEANRAFASALSSLTSGAELWLLTHPCPEPWNGRYFSDIVGVFVAIGRLMVGAGGDPAAADDGRLHEKIEEVCGMVEELKGLVARLQQVADGPATP